MHSTAHCLVASANYVDMQVHQKDMAFKVTRINCLPVGLNYYTSQIVATELCQQIG